MKFNKLAKGLSIGIVSAMMSTAAFAENMTLRFAGVFPIDHQGTKMMEQVAADVAAADVGLKIDVFPANQLGSGESLFEDVARGNIDLAAAFIYADNDPRLEFLSMPFLVGGWDDMNNVMRDMDSEFNRILQEITGDYGVRVIAQNPEGFVGIVATQEPTNWNSFEDKGMNIRVWSSNRPFALSRCTGLRYTRCENALANVGVYHLRLVANTDADHICPRARALAAPIASGVTFEAASMKAAKNESFQQNLALKGRGNSLLFHRFQSASSTDSVSMQELV